MLASENVLSLVTETGVPEQTLRRWKAQGRVGAGLAEGVTSSESQALRDAHRWIKEFEDELALVKAALRSLTLRRWWTQKTAGRRGRTDRAAIRFARQLVLQVFLDRLSPIARGCGHPPTGRSAGSY